MKQKSLAATFRQLHHQPPLVLPNAWDPASARVIESGGASAVATTSAGLSWSHNRRDGHGLSRLQAVAALRAIVQAVEVPVTADIEGGYGAGTRDDVAETVGMVLEAGAVGINLEDAPGKDGEPLLAPKEQGERIRGAREAAENKGLDLFLNARIDVYLAAVGKPEGRLRAVLERAETYLEAGADGIFVPGVSDAATVAALVAGIDAPLNVMAGFGALSVRQLGDLGVARVSLGPAVALAALGLMERITKEVLREGTYSSLEGALSYGTADGLFSRGLSSEGPSVDA
ncbi:MAG: isocitrate lyase/phosphoenolpyruvate mutase family protein [Deltaproteobacteria bacterium]|nr:isocitrate lyase/phosphoenolpyruvate mutase family protein [Deltaproteobacteria bacterium]